jgi:hypothetical protein
MYRKNKQLDKIQYFQLFCLESYRSSKGITGMEALQEFRQAGVFDFLSSGFDVLHGTGRKYLNSVVTDFIARRK